MRLRQAGHLLPQLLHGALPHRSLRRRRPGRHLRGHRRRDRGPQPAAAHLRGHGGPFGPRPRNGPRPAAGRGGHVGGLQDQRPDQAPSLGRGIRHRPATAAATNEVAKDLGHLLLAEFGRQDGRWRTSAAPPSSSRRTGRPTGAVPARHRPRGGHRHALDQHRRRQRRRAPPAGRGADGAGRRLGRLDDRHRRLRRPLRRAAAAAVAGQPGRAARPTR